MICQLMQLISYTTKNCINHKIRVGNIFSQKYQIGLHNKLLGHVILHHQVCKFVEGKSFLTPMRLKQLRQAKLRSEEHTSELQSRGHLVCRLLLYKKKYIDMN